MSIAASHKGSYLVPRPHYCTRPMRFGSRDLSECLFRIGSPLKCTTSCPGRFSLALEVGHPASGGRGCIADSGTVSASKAENKGQFSFFFFFHRNSDSLRSAKDKKYYTFMSIHEATRIKGILRTTRDYETVGLMTG